MNTNKFDIIYDRFELEKIIEFLGNGFSLSLEKRVLFAKLLAGNPPNYPIAAITSRNGTITAAMLLIAQYPYPRTDGLKVLNMSTWYALPEYRGIEPVIFIKNLTKQLDEYTFTNYTPNDVALKILKVFGFNNMKVIKLICGFSLQKIFQYDLNFAKNYFSKTGLLLNSRLQSLHKPFDNKRSNALFYWLHSSRKSFLTLRVLNIYIDQPSAYIHPNIFSIFFTMLRFRAVSLNIFIKFDHTVNERQPLPWLIKCNDVNCTHILPLGSELIALSQKE
jgi:hypothetical protein